MLYTEKQWKLEKQNQCEICKQQKRLYKIYIKNQDIMSHKTLDKNLVAIRKSKVVLKLNKPAYVGMCILGLGKVLMYEFHYDYIRNKYDNKSKLLLTDTDSLCIKLKLKVSSKILAAIKKYLILVIIQLSQNNMMI